MSKTHRHNSHDPNIKSSIIVIADEYDSHHFENIANHVARYRVMIQEKYWDTIRVQIKVQISKYIPTQNVQNTRTAHVHVPAH